MPRPASLLRPAIAALFACLFLAAAAAPRLAAADVLVVLSSDKTPYQQAVEGLKTSLTAQGHRIQLMKLSDLETGPAPSGAACAIAVGTQAAIWLRDHPPAKAIAVYCMVADPDASGLADMRGVTTDVPLTSQLALIGEALPMARVVGMLYRGDQERGRRQVEELTRLLPTDWRLAAIPVEKHQGSADAIDALFAQGVDVVWTAPDTGVYTEAVVRTLLLTALRRRVPVFGFSHPFVRAGGLFGVGINPTTQGTQVASLAQHLLTDAVNPPPGPLCVPPTFEIAVNLVVAQKLSLELPMKLISRATQIFSPGR